jgi:hypothetical protein
MAPIATLLAAALLSSPGFPPPRMAPLTDRIKCDSGTVLSVNTQAGQLRVTAPAGVVTYQAGSDVQVFDKAGQPAGAVGRLAAGQKVRVYYVVENGARAVEIAHE